MSASAIGLGTWPLGGHSYGDVPDQAAREIVENAVTGGIRTFDTADIYGDGRVERLLGEVLAGETDITIVTKGGYLRENGREQNFAHGYLRLAIERSLRRLRRDRVDLFLLHCPPLDADAEALFEAADRLVEQGYCAGVGVSLAHVDQYPLLSAWVGCSAVELIYNLLDQRAYHAGVLADCHRQGRTVLARLPLANGLLAGAYRTGFAFPANDVRARWCQEQIDKWLEASERFAFLTRPDRTMVQAALAFALAAPGRVVPIPGAKTVHQLEENLRSADPERRLGTSEMARAYALWDEVKSVIPTATSASSAP